jgi:hypothetical protein
MTKELNAKAAERREYYRVDDFVALKVEQIPPAEEALLQESFVERRNAFALANDFTKSDQKHFSEFNELRRLYPEVALYIFKLEQRITRLAHLIEQKNDEFPAQPTHKVNISGKGIRFTHWQALTAGDKVLLRLMLYPSLTRILTLAKVVDCVVDRSLSVDEQYYAIRADFARIVDEDRELLVRHIHYVQRQQLRRRLI